MVYFSKLCSETDASKRNLSEYISWRKSHHSFHHRIRVNEANKVLTKMKLRKTVGADGMIEAWKCMGKVRI